MQMAADGVAPASVPVSAGVLLRQARQAQGIALEDLANALKVPIEKLQALENEDWQRLPDVVFLRAVAQTVCRTLQIDAQPVLALLPQQKMAALVPQLGLNEPMRERSVPSIFATNEQRSRWPWALLLLLVLAGVVYVGLQWQAPGLTRGLSSVLDTTPSEAADAPLFPPAVPQEEEGAADEGTTLSAAALMQPAVAEEGGAQPLAEAAAPEGAAEAAVAAVGATPPGSTPVLRITAKGATWVQVTDAQQRLLIEKILQDGEEFITSAPKPLTVAVGKADLATVEVNGAPFDVQALARSNVARFEVK